MVQRARTLSPFIEPATPTLVTEPPHGHDWVHEVKFDGYRMQVHKAGDRIRLFNRNGQDSTRRYPRVVAAAAKVTAWRGERRK
jgi:ATP-dependent DNA ligase